MAENDRVTGRPPPVDEAVNVRPVELPPLDEDRPAPPANAADRDANLAMILDIPVNIRVELGQARLSVQDILRLGAGSVIELNRMAGQTADIVANGKLIGQGDIVVVEENLAIRVTKLVGPEQRIKSI